MLHAEWVEEAVAQIAIHGWPLTSTIYLARANPWLLPAHFVPAQTSMGSPGGSSHKGLRP
jgi:hypothetical protein